MKLTRLFLDIELIIETWSYSCETCLVFVSATGESSERGISTCFAIDFVSKEKSKSSGIRQEFLQVSSNYLHRTYKTEWKFLRRKLLWKFPISSNKLMFLSELQRCDGKYRWRRIYCLWVFTNVKYQSLHILRPLLVSVAKSFNTEIVNE